MLNIHEIEFALSANTDVGRSSGCMFCDVEAQLLIEQTESFYLIKDKFPIAQDHLMIISRDHYGCMGELSLTAFDEIKYLRTRIEKHFGVERFIGYEHGRAGHCVKLKGSQITCHHFHLHYLPLAIDIRSKIAARFNEIALPDISSVRGSYERLGEYLYFEDANRQSFFYPADNRVEPHLLRTLVCEEAQLSHRSDWEKL